MFVKTVTLEIESVSKKLSLSELEENRVKNMAHYLARSYIEKLEKGEDRVPAEVALNSIYLACRFLEIPKTVYEIVNSSKYELWGLHSTYKDMEKRLKLEFLNNKKSYRV